VKSVKLLSILLTALIVMPVLAADAKNLAGANDAAPGQAVESQEDRSSPDAVKRPLRQAVKISPAVRTSPPRPDDSGKMRRVAPARAEAPLQNVPALKNLYPASPQDAAPDASPPQNGEAPAR